VFGLGAFLHASLRDRLQATEQALREKELAEERVKKLAAEARLHSPNCQSKTATQPLRSLSCSGRITGSEVGGVDTRAMHGRPLYCVDKPGVIV